MQELINELEKKQTEIYTDIEDSNYSKEYTDGYIDGYYNAFTLAILIVKEHNNLFKEE